MGRVFGEVGGTYVNTPEFFHAVEADDLLQQLVPILFATGRFGEPQRPGVLEGVLDVEVGRVVEDGDDWVAIGGVFGGAAGRDGDGVEVDGGVGHVGGGGGGVVVGEMQKGGWRSGWRC